jgi:dihydroorotase
MIDTKLLSWAQVAERMSTTPAGIGQIAGHGRPLSPGEPANVTLYDPSTQQVVSEAQVVSKSRNTPYLGMSLPGQVIATFLRGHATVLDGRLTR